MSGRLNFSIGWNLYSVLLTSEGDPWTHPRPNCWWAAAPSTGHRCYCTVCFTVLTPLRYPPKNRKVCGSGKTKSMVETQWCANNFMFESWSSENVLVLILFRSCEVNFSGSQCLCNGTDCYKRIRLFCGFMVSSQSIMVRVILHTNDTPIAVEAFSQETRKRSLFLSLVLCCLNDLKLNLWALAGTSGRRASLGGCGYDTIMSGIVT